MKKYLPFLSLLFIFTSYSCEGDTTSTEPNLGTFRVEADGVEFTGIGTASFSDNAFLGRTFSIGGVESLTSQTGKTCVIVFFLPDGVELDPGSYDQETPCISNTNGEICLTGAYGLLENENDELEWKTNFDANDNITVNFTRVGINSGDRVQGTFSGVFANENGETIEITNGEFNVTVQ
jgi:hypothetical protein